jgi:hypothetical protein
MTDLGPRGLLFALLLPPEGMLGFKAMRIDAALRRYVPHDVPAGYEKGRVFEYLANMSGEFKIPSENWPVLVRFRNAGDPATVERVLPQDVARLYGAACRSASASRQPATTSPLERSRKRYPGCAKPTAR